MTPLCRKKRDHGTPRVVLLTLNLQPPSHEMCSVIHTGRLCEMHRPPPCHSNSAHVGPRLTWEPPELLPCVFWVKLSVLCAQIKTTAVLLWNVACSAHNLGTRHLSSSHFALNTYCARDPDFFHLILITIRGVRYYDYLLFFNDTETWYIQDTCSRPLS